MTEREISQNASIYYRVTNHPSFPGIDRTGRLSIGGHIVYIEKPLRFDDSSKRTVLEVDEYYVDDENQLVFTKKEGYFTNPATQENKNRNPLALFKYTHIILTATGEKAFEGTYKTKKDYEVKEIFVDDRECDKYFCVILKNPNWNIDGPWYISGKNIIDGAVSIKIPDPENPNVATCISYDVKDGSGTPYNLKKTSISQDDYISSGLKNKQ